MAKSNSKKKSGKSPKSSSKKTASKKTTSKKTAVPPSNASTITGPSSWNEIHGRLSIESLPVESLTSPLYASGANSPLSWGIVTSEELNGQVGSPEESLQTVPLCERVAKGKLDSQTREADWNELVQTFAESTKEQVTRETCYQALAWGHASPSLAGLLTPAAWSALLENLVALVGDLIDQGSADDCLVEQLLVELGVTLGVLYPNAAELSTHADELRKRVSFAITDLSDGEGIPRSGIIRDLRPLVASWVRLGLLARETGIRVFEEDAQMQLEWLVRRSSVLSRFGGTPLFCTDMASADGFRTDDSRAERESSQTNISEAAADFFDAALSWEGDQDDARYAASLVHVGPLQPKGKKQKRALANSLALEFDSPTLYSEWASLAVMRSTWESSSPVVGVAFDDRKLLTDISVKRGPLVSGDVTPFVTINGQLAEFSSDISEVCWHSDDECEYLELEVKLGSGWRLQRQYLFSRDDLFLWVADVLLGDEPAQIEYSCPWPISAACQAVPELETRDMAFAINDKIQSSVMAANAAEWRVSRSNCELELSDVGLLHRFETEAKAAYIPLFFDLDKKRAKQERTWRQLTVAEQLDITSPDVAAGFRVQAGDDQWMFYRSLGPRGNRSLLGQNTVAEFLAGRFLRDGLIEELVEVDAGA
jgi:hypothetical protein